MTDEKKPMYFTYKDRVFRLLYRDRNRLLELYNALNDTNYTNVDDLTVTTLENAIFIKMKNDVSFVIDCNMCLYEHQSTYCPNMPLQEAVEHAVDICIEKDILKDFLMEQKSEVIAMSIYEYNEEYVRKVLFEDGVEKGYNRGAEEERIQGIRVLIETCKEVGLAKEETLIKLEEKYNLSKESAEEYLVKYWK